MKNNEIIKKLKDFVKELESEESEVNTTKDLINLPSFADATKEEVKEILRLYRADKIDLKDYWKPGDKKVTEDGCEYVILDIGYDSALGLSNMRTTRTVIIMRTDLVNLEVTMRNIEGNYGSNYSKTVLSRQFLKNPRFFIGNFFSEIAKDVEKELIESSVFLPSEEEIFDKEKAYEYFKNPENRKLGNSWWSRSGFLNSYGRASFVFCCPDGSQYSDFPNSSNGLAPCFVI